MLTGGLVKFIPALALLFLAWTLVSVMPGTASASNRSETAVRAQAGLALVDSLLETGQAARAVSEAQRLYRQLGTDPLYGWQVEGRLGLALLRAGYPAEALPYLEALMRRTPNDHAAHRNFASALMETGKKGRALTEFRLAVELAPGDYEARMDYGRILAEFRDVREARTQFEVARTLCPDCPEADISLAGLCWERAGSMRPSSHSGGSWTGNRRPGPDGDWSRPCPAPAATGNCSIFWMPGPWKVCRPRR